MIVHQNSNVRIEYDPSTKRLTQTWTGFISSKEFKVAIDQTVAFAEKNLVTSIISDTLNQGVVKPEDTEYAASVMPTLFRKGLRKMAFVIPENIFTQLSLKKFADKERNENVQYFKSVSDAQKWINQS